MAAFRLRGFVTLFLQGNSGLRKPANVQSKLQMAAISLRMSDRAAHTKAITKNISFITDDNKTDVKLDRNNLRLTNKESRPVCIIMSWMVAKSRHLLKYSRIYLDMGYDVVTVSCSPMQLMLPTRGSQLIAADLLKFLETNDDVRPLVVHGFSVGAYVWAELLVHALKDLERYQPVLDRVAAQTWDSPADVYELPVGLPLALFPQNKPLQKLLTTYAKIHMRVFHGIATRHYLTATDAYHNTPCHAPTLFLVSRTDPVGAEKRSRRAYDMMVSAGMKCKWKCWDDSPHVRHYNQHPEEYLEVLLSHLQDCGLPSKPIQTKIQS